MLTLKLEKRIVLLWRTFVTFKTNGLLTTYRKSQKSNLKTTFTHSCQV